MITSPSSNNACDFFHAQVWCLTSAKTFPAPDPTVTPGFLTIHLTGSGQELVGYGTAMDGYMGAPRLAYGEAVRYGDFAVGSTTSGLTVWNTTTGHGALVNTSGITQF